MKGYRPLRRGLKVVIASWYVSGGNLGVSAEGAANLWLLLEMVAMIIIIDLLSYC